MARADFRKPKECMGESRRVAAPPAWKGCAMAGYRYRESYKYKKSNITRNTLTYMAAGRWNEMVLAAQWLAM